MGGSVSVILRSNSVVVLCLSDMRSLFGIAVVQSPVWYAIPEGALQSKTQAQAPRGLKNRCHLKNQDVLVRRFAQSKVVIVNEQKFCATASVRLEISRWSVLYSRTLRRL